MSAGEVSVNFCLRFMFKTQLESSSLLRFGFYNRTVLSCSFEFHAKCDHHQAIGVLLFYIYMIDFSFDVFVFYF